MKNTIFFVLLLVLTSLAVSCKKEADSAPEQSFQNIIPGKWRATTFRVDGTEQLGQLIESSTLEFKPSVAQQGAVEWLVYHTDGTFKVESGDYQLNERSAVIDIHTVQDHRFSLGVRVMDSTKLVFSGDYFGEQVSISAIKE